MAAPRYPQRPNSNVYRRRRIIALVVLVSLIAFVWWGVASIVGAISNFFNPPTTSTSETTGTTATGEIAACINGTVSIDAVVATKDGTAAASFDPGVNPYIGYKITNNSEVDCTFDVGAATTFYTITSGAETIWTSKQCTDRAALTASVITLKAGETLESPLSPWARVYSSATGCGADQKAVTAEGASYHLQAEVASVISTDTAQFILN